MPKVDIISFTGRIILRLMRLGFLRYTYCYFSQHTGDDMVDQGSCECIQITLVNTFKQSVMVVYALLLIGCCK